MRRAARIDANQRELVRALRDLGWLVAVSSSLGNGFPDAVVSRSGVVRLVEFKRAKGTLTGPQEAFHGLWPVTILRTIDDARELR